MPCSRTPNLMLRPCGVVGLNSAAFGNSVLVDSDRSAAPPIIVGVKSSNAAMTFWPAARVASLSLPHSMFSSASPTPGIGFGLSSHTASHSRARASCVLRHASKRSVHSPSRRAPRSVWSKCSYTPSGTTNVLSGSQPRISLVARTSSSPSGEPCAFDVPCLCGAGQPMMLRTLMSDGRSSSSMAAWIARESSSRSLTSSTFSVCQP